MDKEFNLSEKIVNWRVGDKWYNELDVKEFTRLSMIDLRDPTLARVNMALRFKERAGKELI